MSCVISKDEQLLHHKPQITVPATLPSGIYVLVLRNTAGNDIKRIKLMVE